MVYHETPRVSFSKAKPDQWTATFWDGSKIDWTTNKFPAFDAFHPLGWVLQGAFYYPEKSPERFPTPAANEAPSAYFKRIAGDFDVVNLTKEEKESIWTAKQEELQTAAKAEAMWRQGPPNKK